MQLRMNSYVFRNLIGSLAQMKIRMYHENTSALMNLMKNL